MNKFEQQIGNIIRTEVEFSSKERLRNKIMQEHVYVDSYFARVIKSMQSVRLSVNTRVLMKEKLLMYVDATAESFLERLFTRPLVRRFGASFAAFVLVFTIVVQPFSSVNMAKASVPASITSYSGNVFVYRGDDRIAVESGFVLQQGDVLVTGPAGFAEIVFADDSLARLGNDSKLKINSLEANFVNSKISLKLDNGVLWTNTLGLNGSNASFQVYADELIVSSKIESVFNVEVTKDFSRVVALEKGLSLELFAEGEYLPADLQKGQVVKVKKETPVTTYLDTQLFQEKLTDFDLEWLTSNFKQDEFYANLIADSKLTLLKDDAGITPESLFYPIKEFRRSAKLAFTFDPIRQSELELSFANEKMTEAQALIAEGKYEYAEDLIKEYSNAVEIASERVKSIALKTPEGNSVKRVIELRSNISDSVGLQKKNIKDSLSIADGLALKQVLNQAELLVASNKTEKTKIQIAQVNELLDDAVGLAKENRPELVTQNLVQFTKQIAQIATDVESLPDSEKADVITTVIEQGVQSLTAIQELQDAADADSNKSDGSNPTVLQNTNIGAELDKKIEEVKLFSEQSLELSIDIAKEVKGQAVINDIKKVSETINIAENATVISSPNLIVDTVNIPTAIQLGEGQKIQVTPSVVLPLLPIAPVQPLIDPVTGLPVDPLLVQPVAPITVPNTEANFVQSALKFLN